MSKYGVLAAAKGRRGKWRVGENKNATAGNSLRFEFCQKMGVGSMASDC